MLAVVLVALAVPLAVVILGLRQVAPRPAGPAPEIPELRSSLEQVADQHLRAPDLVADAPIVLPGKSDKLAGIRTKIERAAESAGGSTLATELPQGGFRLLVKVPAANTKTFESAALPEKPAKPAGSGLYEIQILPEP